MWSTSILFSFLVFASTHHPSCAFMMSTTPSTPSTKTTTRQFASTSVSQDTPETLPEFPSVDAYLEYLETVSQLPKGFATGTADGTFISVEAPGLGNLKIRGTIIQMTEGPTESWAACFTSNKVSMRIGCRCLVRMLGKSHTFLLFLFHDDSSLGHLSRSEEKGWHLVDHSKPLSSTTRYPTSVQEATGKQMPNSSVKLSPMR
jgi:hypothetical protein